MAEGVASTLIAADQCGRHARLVELDPLYCDTIIRRFERVTGGQALLARAAMSLAQVAKDRPGAGKPALAAGAHEKGNEGGVDPASKQWSGAAMVTGRAPQFGVTYGRVPKNPRLQQLQRPTPCNLLQDPSQQGAG